MSLTYSQFNRVFGMDAKGWRTAAPRINREDMHFWGGNLWKKDFKKKKENTLLTKKKVRFKKKERKRSFDQEKKKENKFLTKKKTKHDLDQ